MPAFIRQHPARFWRWHLGLPLLLGLLLWQVYPVTGLDDLIEHWYYDPAARAFPLRDVLWLTAGAHSGLKMLVIAVGLAAFFAWLASFFELGLRLERRRFGWIWGAIALASVAVSLLKQGSIHHCHGISPIMAAMRRIWRCSMRCRPESRRGAASRLDMRRAALR